MKRSLKNITGYSVEMLDGPKGKVKDFLFDEDSWIIRYLEVGFGNLFMDKRILIPKTFLKEPDWSRKHFPVNLNQKDLESCPVLDEHAPVSREYEKQLSKHYEIDYYWPTLYAPPVGATPYYPPRPLHSPSKIVDEEDIETSLRSFAEVKGYHIHATDGKLGHVDDIIAEDEDWQIVYLIIDTSNWRPWSKVVILSIDWLDQISYTKREVSINLKSEHIKNAPEYDPSHPIDMDYEKVLYDYYRKILNQS